MSHQPGTPSVPVRTFFPLVAAVALVALAEVTVRAASADKNVAAADSAAQSEARLLTSSRQLTFEGRRAGEGYFSADGSRMVFQSEREPGNPFFQIYWMDLETGDVQRISPGYGKTTCAWIHSDGRRVLFASTHADAESRQKQPTNSSCGSRGSSGGTRGTTTNTSICTSTMSRLSSSGI